MLKELNRAVLAKLTCPACGGGLVQDSPGTLKCRGCGCGFASDGVVDLLVDKTLRTALEDVDYDSTAGYNDVSIERIGKAWLTVFGNAGLSVDGKRVLEIGAGTGALTIALLRGSRVGELFATDISDAFLRKTMERARADERLTSVRCDCNNLPIRDASFDLVVGRSILHHLLDYDQVLGQCARILGTGGKAIFFEPMLEGKLVVAMFTAMIVDLAKRDKDPDFTQQELNKMEGMVRHITKASWLPQTREELVRIEDKYIFTLAGMMEKGLAAKFSKVELLFDDRPVDPSLWSNTAQTLRILGIDPKKLEKYRILGSGYARTFGAFSQFNYAPMGYFCFTV